METLSREEFALQHPNLIKHNNWHVISKETAQEYKASKIVLPNPLTSYRSIDISSKFLGELASNYALFSRVKKTFEDPSNTDFVLYYDDRQIRVMNISRFALINGLESLITSQQPPENLPQLTYAFNEITKASSFTKLSKHYQGKTFSYEIDGKVVDFVADDFLKFLTLPEDQFLAAIEDFSSFSSSSTREEFLYALSEFVTAEKVFDRSYFPTELVLRFQNLNDFKIVDYQSIGELTETQNRYLDKTFVSPELEDAVVRDMPPNYNDLQKSVYIYLKLCQLLTYDTEFYAVNQKGPRIKKHTNISHVKEITPDNNDAVCYEFSVIYGKLLSQHTNSTHELVFKNSMFGSGRYGNDHTFLEIRSDKFLLRADSIRGVMSSDLTNQKVGRQINGLTCLNKSRDTAMEFKQTLNQVSEDLKAQTIINAGKDLPTDFQSSVEAYRAMQDENAPYIDVRTRLDFMTKQIEDLGLTGIDALAYMLQLRKTTFSTKEQYENVFINVLREQPVLPDGDVFSTAVVTLSDNYREKDAECEYVIYRPGEPLVDTPREEMCDLFNNGNLSYVSLYDEPVPGLNAPVCDLFYLNQKEFE